LLALAYNPFLHLDVAMTLAARPENLITRALARNTHHPEVLETLATRRDRGITPTSLMRVPQA